MNVKLVDIIALKKCVKITSNLVAKMTQKIEKFCLCL